MSWFLDVILSHPKVFRNSTFKAPINRSYKILRKDNGYFTVVLKKSSGSSRASSNNLSLTIFRVLARNVEEMPKNLQSTVKDKLRQLENEQSENYYR